MSASTAVKTNGEASKSLENDKNPKEEIINEDPSVPATDAAKKKKKKNKNKSTNGETEEPADVNDVEVVAEKLDKVQIDNNESNEEEDDAGEEGGENAGAAKKKKKKKKKKVTGEVTATIQPGQPKPAKKQTTPPTIPICELYPTGNFPVGQIMDYPVPKDMDA